MPCRARIEVIALRRPELVLRSTRYEQVIVDERVLTRAFSWIAPPSRLQALALVEGRIIFEAGRSSIEVAPGDVVLLTPPMASRARFERAAFIDLEWNADAVNALDVPRVVRRTDTSPLVQLANVIRDVTRSHRSVFAEAFAVFASAGAPLGALSALELEGGPTARESRLACAIEAQLRDLATSAGSVNLGELADLSPRQLQRVVEELTARYGINAGNWRDMRNRWRIQIAAVLLSVPELTLGDVAAEVGYASASALARAFANAGLPPPSEIRTL
jgi:AraC-like DNA-binding protein